MERENNKLKFTIIWSSCIFTLLLMIGVGVISSFKGTSAAQVVVPGAGGGTSDENSGSDGSGSSDNDGTGCTNVDDDGNCVTPDTGGNADEDGKNCNVTSCPAGQYVYTDEDGCKKCVACLGNHYCPEDTVTPTKCPPETPYSYGGSDSSNDCVTGWCYECNGTAGLFEWRAPNSTGISCGGGWHARNDITSKAACTGTGQTTTKYTISYASGGGSGSMGSESVSKGSSYIIKSNSFTKTCYSFTGWSGSDGKSYSDGATIPNVSSDITLTAKWGDYSCGNTNHGSGGSGGGTVTPPSSNPSPNEPSSSDPSGEVISSRPSNENVETNPQTGNIAIFVVWVVAAMAIVYSIWYFKQVREN